MISIIKGDSAFRFTCPFSWVDSQFSGSYSWGEFVRSWTWQLNLLAVVVASEVNSVFAVLHSHWGNGTWGTLLRSQSESSDVSDFAKLNTHPAECSIGTAGRWGELSSFQNINDGNFSLLLNPSCRSFIVVLIFSIAVIEFELNVCWTRQNHNSDGLWMDWGEVESFNTSDDHFSDYNFGDSSESDTIIRFFNGELGQCISLDVLDIKSVEGFHSIKEDTNPLESRSWRWPSVDIGVVINLETVSSSDNWTVDNLSVALGQSSFKIVFVGFSDCENILGDFNFFIWASWPEVHINWIPCEFGDGWGTDTRVQVVSGLTFFTSLDISLINATLCVGEAQTSMQIVWGSTFNTSTTWVSSTSIVLNFTFVELVQEVQSVTIGAVTLLTEVPTVFISILTSTILINSVSFNTFVASFSPRDQTFRILNSTWSILCNLEPRFTRNTFIFFHSITVDNWT